MSALEAVDVEREIIGNLLANSDGWPHAEGLLPEDFSQANHGVIFRAMLAVRARGLEPDHLTLAEQLKVQGQLVAVGGPAALMAMDAGVGLFANFPKHIATLKSLARHRAVAAAYRAAAAEAEDPTKPLPVLAASTSQRVLAYADADDGDADRMGDADVEAVNDRWLRHYEGEAGPFLPVGIDAIDGIFKGFHTNVNLIGGKASIGKTAKVATIVWGWLEKGIPGGIFGLEDGTEWLWERHCSRKVGIPYADVGACYLHEYQMGSYQDAMEKARVMLGTLLRTHCVSGLSGPDLLAKARRWIKRGAKWILIDHGGRIEHQRTHDKEDNALGIKRTVQALDDLAHNEGVPIIVNWHFNRSGAIAGLPTMEAFRETGYLEMFAGSMLGLWERPENEGELLVTCVKNRKGPRDWTVAVQRDAKHGLVHPVNARLLDLKAEAQEARALRESERSPRQGKKTGGIFS